MMVKWLGLWFLILGTGLSAVAQDAPVNRAEAQNRLLADLAERLDVPNLTLGTLANYSWRYGQYDFVLALGCPSAPSAAPSAGVWQRHTFVYGGTEYAYLISEDLQTIIACDESLFDTDQPPAPSVLPTATPTPTTSEPIAPVGVPDDVATRLPQATALACPMPPRLQVGRAGRVTPGEPNWVHAEARRSSTKIGEIPGDAVFAVTGSPVCDETTGMIFWPITYRDLRGYTAEGWNGTYWVVPESRSQADTVISAANAASLQQTEWAGALGAGAQVQYAAGVDLFALANEDGVIQLRDLDGDTTKAVIVVGAPVSQMMFNPDGRLLATVALNGSIQTWSTEGNLLAEIDLSDPVNALAWSGTGLLAIGSETGAITIWDGQRASNRPLAALVVGRPVAQLSFSANGELLVATSAEGFLLGAWRPAAVTD